MKKILISNVEIVTDGPAYKKKYIGITGNKISYIGIKKPKGYEDAYQIDGTGKLAAAGQKQACRKATAMWVPSWAFWKC